MNAVVDRVFRKFLETHPLARWLLRTGALLGILGNNALSQDWQFAYDVNGNLLKQTVESPVPPQIIGQPQTQIVQPGELGSFFVVARDTRGLTYQWRTNGVNLSGATSDALLLTNVTALNEGLYSVVLSNSSGSVTSAPAMLWLDADGDGLPDSWELAYFGNLNQNPFSDFDGDGVSNLDEFRDGTNPTNNASAQFRLIVMSDGGQVSVSPTKLSYTNGETVTVSATPLGSEVFHIWTGEVITRSNPVTLVMTNNKTLFAHFSPIIFAFTNSAGGDWHNPSNWSPNLVPSALDDVAPLPAVTITINAPAECHALTFNGGTLTGTGNLSIYGDAIWSSGTLSGSGRLIIAAGATLTINNGSSLSLSRSLENGGIVAWAGNSVISLNDVVITNRAGALFRAENAQSFIVGSGTPRFDNAGTFRKLNNSGTTIINSGVAFNNFATVEVQSGVLLHAGNFFNVGNISVAAGGTHRMSGGGSSTGTFSNSPAALVEWTGSTFSLNSGAQLNGVGSYRINGGTLNFNVDLWAQNLDLFSGTLTGAGNVTVSNTMTWISGGLSAGGRLIIAPGATMTITNGSSLNRMLENGGTVVWTGGSQLVVSDVVITNRLGALFHVQNAANIINFSGSPRFDNAGTFRKSSNTGSTAFTVPFNNYGTVDLQTGTLQYSVNFLNNGAVTLAAGTTNRIAWFGSASGTFNATATALVEWTGAGTTFTLNPGAQLTGSGQYRINGGTLDFSADLSTQNLDLLGGTLTGAGNVTVGNAMTWSSGTLTGGGRLIIAAGATMAIGNGSSFNRMLENGGTVVWTGGSQLTVSDVVITNRPGALFHVQNAANIINFNGFPRFDNAGTFRKSSNTGNTAFTVPFNNYGTVDIRSGILIVNGGYSPASSSLLKCALGGTTAGTGYGQLQKSGTINLDGALSVDLLPGFTPATNDTFTVVSAGTRSGTFANSSYPSNRVAMQLNYTATSAVLTTTEVFPVPQPSLLKPQLLVSNVLLTWTATSNVTYRLEQKSDLAGTNWTGISGDVTTTSNTASKLDPLTTSNRFYRVRVLP